jgi:hypothetical protein
MEEANSHLLATLVHGQRLILQRLRRLHQLIGGQAQEDLNALDRRIRQADQDLDTMDQAPPPLGGRAQRSTTMTDPGDVTAAQVTADFIDYRDDVLAKFAELQAVIDAGSGGAIPRDVQDALNALDASIRSADESIPPSTTTPPPGDGTGTGETPPPSDGGGDGGTISG